MTQDMNPAGGNGRDAFDAAAAARSRASTLVGRSAATNGRMLCLFGLLFGALAVAVGLTAHRTAAGLILAISAFVVVLQLLVFGRESATVATRRGWSRRAGVAIGLVGILYAVAVALAGFQVVGPVVVFWVAAGLIVSLPALAVGAREMRRS